MANLESEAFYLGFKDPAHYGLFEPSSFDFFTLGFLTNYLALPERRKQQSVLDPTPSTPFSEQWAAACLRLLALFPLDDLRPSESEQDAVFVQALAFKAHKLRRRLAELVPDRVRDEQGKLVGWVEPWGKRRRAWFLAGRRVQRRMEELVAQATGRELWKCLERKQG